jgi:pyruvate/2-oxoglutarate dehydrogenase complex dihydrolipoamide dehydrogenase (E3) component
MLPETAENALRRNQADFIAMGRELIAEPYLVQKLQEGRARDITPCITCYECLGLPRKMICSVNPRVGEEGAYPYPVEKSDTVKKVIVLGSGPGGMVAARIAALRGHGVTLYEKTKKLGGKLLSADKAPDKKNVGLFTDLLKRQIAECGVRVIREETPTAESIIRRRPDVVIIATGGLPVIPEIKGLSRARVLDAQDVITGKTDPGNKTVIIGGELVGCEVAGILFDRRVADITITTLLPDLATGLSIPRLRNHLIAGLKKKGIRSHTGVSYKEADEKHLIIVDPEGRERALEFDSIVLATGTRADHTLRDQLEGKVPAVFCIGDAAGGKKLMDAVHDGFKAAYAI